MVGGFIVVYLIRDWLSIGEMVEEVELIGGEELFMGGMIVILLGGFTKWGEFGFYMWVGEGMEGGRGVRGYVH